MKKTLRKALKLLPPAFLMRIWLDRRYGIKVRPAPGGQVARLALAILPYAFTAALSVRVETDRRLLKYFLPYGRMKRFVRLMYNIRVGDDSKDKGSTGMLRAVMPYGLVLWWDAEDAQAGGGGLHRADAPADENAHVCGLSAAERRRELARLDRIEAMTLRLLIMSSREEAE